MVETVLWVAFSIALFILGMVIGYGVGSYEESNSKSHNRPKEDLEIAELAVLKSDLAKDKIFEDKLKNIQYRIAQEIKKGGNFIFIQFSADENWLASRVTERLHIFGYKIEKEWGYQYKYKVSWGS